MLRTAKTHLEALDTDRFTVESTELYFAPDGAALERTSNTASRRVLEVEWCEDVRFAQRIRVGFQK